MKTEQTKKQKLLKELRDAAKGKKPQPNPRVKTKQEYEVVVRCLVNAYSEEDAQEELIASLAFMRRTRDCPMGAEVVESCPVTVEGRKLAHFDLVVPKPKVESVRKTVWKTHDKPKTSKADPIQVTRQAISRHAELEHKQHTWLKHNGPKLSDDELNELCNLRKAARAEQ